MTSCSHCGRAVRTAARSPTGPAKPTCSAGRVSGPPGPRMPELLSDLIRSRLGAEHDADIPLDRAGVTIHDGGMSTALRDLARFDQMLADDGRCLTGEQVLPASWL